MSFDRIPIKKGLGIEIWTLPSLSFLPNQYIKSETSESTPEGQVAKAIRQITEKASKRIGKKAFEVALAREQLRSKTGLAAVGGGAKVTVCHKVSNGWRWFVFFKLEFFPKVKSDLVPEKLRPRGAVFWKGQASLVEQSQSQDARREFLRLIFFPCLSSIYLFSLSSSIPSQTFCQSLMVFSVPLYDRFMKKMQFQKVVQEDIPLSNWMNNWLTLWSIDCSENLMFSM